MTNTDKYAEGQQVWVWDTGYRRWYKGKTLWINRTADHYLGEAWTVELRSGARGSWKAEFMRPEIDRPRNLRSLG